MKIIILKNNLIEALSSVEKAVSCENNLPILKSVKLEAGENNSITLISTNLELAIRHKISGKVINKGISIIPFSFFNSIIRNLNTEKVHLEYKNKKLTIKADNYEGVLNCDNPREFPIIPEIQDKSKSIEIKSKLLKKFLSRALIATQYSEIRPEINGIYFNIKANQLTLVGTDSFRLVEEVLDINEIETNFSDLKMIVPLKTAENILKITSNEGQVSIYTDSNQVLFENGNKMVISRLVNGNFPDYKNIIPKGSSEEIIVNRDELINAIELTKVFAGKASDITFKISTNGKVLEVYSVNDIIGKNNYRVPVSTEGKKEEIKISFNWRYILDGLKIYENNEVVLGFNNSEKPVVVRDKKEKRVVYIVMPIRSATP